MRAIIHLISAILKWTELGDSRQFEEVKMSFMKLDDSKRLKLDGLRKWTVPKSTFRPLSYFWNVHFGPDSFDIINRIRRNIETKDRLTWSPGRSRLDQKL